jgi:hypothetical protein
VRLVTLLAGTIALLGQDAADWIAMGRGDSVRSVNGPVTITYELGSKQFSAAVVPVDGTVARMQRREVSRQAR